MPYDLLVPTGGTGNSSWIEQDTFGSDPVHTLRWAKNLDVTYRSEDPDKVCKVDFPKEDLDLIIASAYFFLRHNIHSKNLLVPHVQFVVGVEKNNGEKTRVCLDGGHLYFGKKPNYGRNRVSVFVSGPAPVNVDPLKAKELAKKCNYLFNHTGKENAPELEFFFKRDLPAEDRTGGHGHSEEWFLRCLKNKPEVLVHNLILSLLAEFSPGTANNYDKKPKLYAVVLNLRSLKDICGACRKEVSSRIRDETELLGPLKKSCSTFFRFSKSHLTCFAVRCFSNQNHGGEENRRLTFNCTLPTDNNEGIFDIREIAEKKLILASRASNSLQFYNPNHTNHALNTLEERLSVESLIKLTKFFAKDNPLVYRDAWKLCNHRSQKEPESLPLKIQLARIYAKKEVQGQRKEQANNKARNLYREVITTIGLETSSSGASKTAKTTLLWLEEHSVSNRELIRNAFQELEIEKDNFFSSSSSSEDD